jgi:hypothetical protein
MLQFKLWLRLESTDKVAFTKLLLVSGLSPGFLSAFDEPSLNGVIENCSGVRRENQDPDAADYCKTRSDRATNLLGESGS